MAVHYIQAKILKNLLYVESSGYARLRPAGLESNLFAYHLEQLLKDGFVAKIDKTYRLAPRGLALVDRMSQEKMVDRLQPHILTVISITNAKGQTLLYKRGFQPYIHKLGFPLGKTHLEETIQQAAERELYEKTGLQDIPLTQRGMVYVHITQAGFTITKALCHVFEGSLTEALPTTSSHRGSCEWLDISTLEPSELMPGCLDIAQLLTAQIPGLFFAEYFYELES